MIAGRLGGVESARRNQPSRASRALSFGLIIGAHLVAITCTFTAFVTVPLVTGTLGYIALFLIAIVFGGGPGSPIAMPLMWVLVVVIGGGFSLLIFVIGDTARRLLGRHMMIAPAVVLLLVAIASLIGRLASDTTFAHGLVQAAAITCVAAVAIAAYWIPLAVCDLTPRAILRAIQRRSPPSLSAAKPPII